MKKTSIAFGADHAGFNYKQLLSSSLSGYSIKDFGSYNEMPSDYPDFAHPLAAAVEKGDYDFGVLLCGSANGVAITANKHAGIRAAICWNEEVAALARSHNNANIICIPARFVSATLAKEILTTFLNTPFEGGKHAKRVNKIEDTNPL